MGGWGVDGTLRGSGMKMDAGTTTRLGRDEFCATRGLGVASIGCKLDWEHGVGKEGKRS